jgi:hypothetical protein
MGNAGTGVSGTQLFVSTGDYSRALELLDAFYKNESFDAETDEDAAQEPDLSASEEDVARKFYSAEDTAEASGMDFATRKHIFRTGLLIVLILMGIFFLLRISGVLLWLAMSFF